MKHTRRTLTTFAFFLIVLGVIAATILLSRKVQKTDTTAKRSSAAGCAMHFVISAPVTSPIGTNTPTPTALPTATPTPTPTVAPTPTPTPTPVPRSVSFTGKFSGVTSDVGPIKATYLDDAGMSTTLTFNYVSNGIYKAVLSIGSQTLPTTLSFQIKPEKHLQRVYRDMPTASLSFDLSSKTFEPGDLSPQDGIINLSDLNTVISILAKATQTTLDKSIADVNYDGIVNAADMSTILSTLSTRPDESF